MSKEASKKASARAAKKPAKKAGKKPSAPARKPAGRARPAAKKPAGTQAAAKKAPAKKATAKKTGTKRPAVKKSATRAVVEKAARRAAGTIGPKAAARDATAVEEAIVSRRGARKPGAAPVRPRGAALRVAEGPGGERAVARAPRAKKPAAVAAPGPRVVENPIKIGIIGTGGWAAYHADRFREHGARLVGCLDIDPERARAFAEQKGVERVCGGLDEVLDRVDAVSIVTSDASHAEYTLAALAAGKHVMCEKPLTTTLADAHEVADAARRATANGQVHCINFTQRNHAFFEAARKLIEEGSIGRVSQAIGAYEQSWLTQDAWGHWSSPSWLWRIRRPAGVLVDIGVHLLDMATALVGDPLRLRCDLRTLPKVHEGREVSEWQGTPLDADDIATIEMELAGGGFGLLQTSRWATGHLNRTYLEVSGTEGAVRLDLDAGSTKLRICRGEDVRAAAWRTVDLEPVPHLWARFVEACERREPMDPDLVRGAHVQAMLHACAASNSSGTWEAVPARAVGAEPHAAGPVLPDHAPAEPAAV